MHWDLIVAWLPEDKAECPKSQGRHQNVHTHHPFIRSQITIGVSVQMDGCMEDEVCTTFLSAVQAIPPKLNAGREPNSVLACGNLFTVY